MIYFSLLFATLLFIDFHFTKGKEVSVKRALSLTVFYLCCALGFAGYIYLRHGIGSAAEFTTIYFLEQLLSVDNLLVISLIFGYFGIDKSKQHTALLYGIIGAIVARVGFIVGGAALIERFEYLLYIFASFLIYTGVKISWSGSDGISSESGSDEEVPTLVRWLSKHTGKLGTFLAAIIAIELSDIMFAVDSIPASFSVSRDAFIVLSANLFAVIGLRSLYHAVAYGLSIVEGLERYIGLTLVFLGLEVVVHHWVTIPSWVTMLATFTIILFGVAASLIKRKKQEEISLTRASIYGEI